MKAPPHLFSRALAILLVGLGTACWLNSRVRAENMSSDSYRIQFSNLNMTSGTKTSGSYNLTDTNGQTGAGFYGGNTNVKSGFQYIYPFGTPSPSPSVSPSVSPSPTLTPFPSATPTPILPPPEGLAGLLEPLLTTPIGQFIQENFPQIADLAPLLITAAAAAQVVTSFLPLILELISRLLQSLGLIPVKRPRGVVFDTKTGKPIAFVSVTFIRVADNEIVDTVISDTSGVYRSIKLPIGTYRIEAVHSEYIFPTKLTPKFLVNPHDFYRGEAFEIRSSNQEELFLIPMDPLFEETVKQRVFYIQIFFSFMRRVLHNLFYPIVIFSVIFTIIFPTPLNILIVILYAVMIVYRVRHTKRQPLLTGVVIDRYGKPIPDTMIKCIESGTNHVAALLVTDAQGAFKVNLPPHQYNLLVNKDGYVIEQRSQDYTNVFIGHTGNEGVLTIHMMTVAEAFPESV